MALSEIEKLERRYAENPQGLTFAPLAEVHRKNGDVSRALDLLRPGLELHPNYIPASIVLGRCHLDLGDLPAAETAFSHVLSLDGENVIALKALADINERLHHFDQAERWLNQLLSVDRSNDDARAQLQRIETARAQASEAAARSAQLPEAMLEAAPESPGPESSVTAAEPVPAKPAAALEAPDFQVEEPATLSSRRDVQEQPDKARLELEDLEYSALAADANEHPPEGFQDEEVKPVEATVEPLPGLVGREVDQPSADEFQVETSEDIILRSSGGGEFQVPDASEELYAAGPPAEPPLFGGERYGEPRRDDDRPGEPEAVSAPEPVADLETVPDLETAPDLETVPDLEPDAQVEPESHAAAALEPDTTPEPDAEALPSAETQPAAAVHEELVAQAEPESVVTETMAEVLRQQGHPVEALRVYRELEVRGAGDERTRQRIAELETETEPERVPAAPRRAYTAAETKGESVATFFRRLLAARLPAPAGAPATPPSAAAPVHADSAGAPTRPAADALSLSSVFGEEASALPPAVPAPDAAAAGVSFDEFFSPSSGTGGGGGSATPGPRAARTPDAKSDDLDQFHAWLQNLKR